MQCYRPEQNMATNCGADATNLHSDPMMIPVISYIDNYTKTAINHYLEHSSTKQYATITNFFFIVLYYVVQLRSDNSQYPNMLCYVMEWTANDFYGHRDCRL